MANLHIPGHDRDAMPERLPEHLQMVVDLAAPAAKYETAASIHDVFALTSESLLGMDDARLLVDQMAAREWEAMIDENGIEDLLDDEYVPTAADRAVALAAAQG